MRKKPFAPARRKSRKSRESRSSFSKRGNSGSARFGRSEKPAFKKREGGDRAGRFEKRFDADNSKPFRKKSFDREKINHDLNGRVGFSKSPGNFRDKKSDRPEGRGFNKPKEDRFEKRSFGDSKRGDKPEFKKRNSTFSREGFDKPRIGSV
jgi:hypothetical protein